MEKMLRKYAELIVNTGIDVKEGDTLILNTPVECVELARQVVECAYQKGASDVVVRWSDDFVQRCKYKYAPEEMLDIIPKWFVESSETYIEKGASVLAIIAPNPEAFADVDPARVARAVRAKIAATAKESQRLMGHKNPWCGFSAPTKAWAKKVYPELSEADAINELWEDIFKVMRLDQEDSIKAWKTHTDEMAVATEFLNSHKFKELRFENSLGTDLHVGLPEKHVWTNALVKNADGKSYIINMPSEEVLSSPEKTGVNGVVYSSMPLVYDGKIIDHFAMTFENGKVTDFSAEKGYDVLKSLLETDEGSSYLGEVALVSKDSPVAKTGALYYNTLYDENAACHLAVGRAYANNIKGGVEMSQEELTEAGANYSSIHVDFMIGTADMKVTGITREGDEVPVFIDGTWSFDLDVKSE